LSFDFLGGEGASSGPSNRDDGFPLVTPSDQARALAVALDALSVRRLHAFVGASYGGMVGLSFAERTPERVARLLVLCAGHRPHPLATAWRSIQRDVVRLGLDSGHAQRALSLARALAVTTYRSAREFDSRFAWPARTGEGPARFDVQSYLEHQGERFAGKFSAEAFLCLSASIDLQSVRPELVKVPTTLVGADTDVLVPLSLLRELRDQLGAPCELIELASAYGHDAFLKEEERVGAIVRSVLSGEVKP